MESRGRTTTMLINAVRYAANNPGCAVLVCMQEEDRVLGARLKALRLAKAMGLEVDIPAMHSFFVGESQIHFRPNARSMQHASKLQAEGKEVLTFHDHKTCGELEE